MLLNFTKMHGCGNDFMIIDMRKEHYSQDPKVSASLSPGMTQDLIKRLADYKTSVGFDQLITIKNSSEADIEIDIFNSDGSKALACGNGTRCVAKLILEELGSQEITIATANRVLKAYLQNGLIAVDMGMAQILQEDVRFSAASSQKSASLIFRDEAMQVRDDAITADLVDIGNPHIIINDADNLDILKYGPLIENDARFPNKVNVNFAKIISRNLVELRVWERGAGATLACGTGACATFFLLYSKGLINKEAVIRQLGGDLKLSILNDNILMAGEAKISYQGIISE